MAAEKGAVMSSSHGNSPAWASDSTRLAALDKKDLAVATRCSELQGKSLKMFVERQEINAPAEELGMTAEEEQYQRDYAAWRLDQEALKSRQNIQFRSN